MSPTRPNIADTTTMTTGGPEARPAAAAGIPALRKAAILVVSLEQKMASMLLAQLDRAEVEAVTLEIARLDRIDPEEQRSVLEEFYGLGVRRMRFVFDDVARLDPADLRAAYRDEDARTWALALAGISHAAQGRVLGALDPGDARRLEAMLAALGPFRLKDAEAAQADLADLLRGLHDRGRLTLPAPVEAGAVLV
jgi:flagellar motor switch protein FliG